MDTNPTNDSGRTDATIENVSDSELRELAEDIVNYCPSLTQLLLAVTGRGNSTDN